ncbi:hypothetical protein E6C27_scaffold55G001410 [Cucumis melo var. makuwa]|uniref:Uncharacterized protein n=1 Tax=Cucumis melo var. makuwa TaxID=1194695 RepID=A0A5A7UD92_CUCMM|nr:hypothetical protein E6C27_scaffold55G001410 [Cucumis melo var. makuwa]
MGGSTYSLVGAEDTQQTRKPEPKGQFILVRIMAIDIESAFKHPKGTSGMRRVKGQDSLSENDITPEIGRKRSGQHKGTSNFQKVTIFTFGNPILLGGDCNLCIELDFYGVKEVLECGGNFEFVGDRENPSKTSMVINKGHKPPFPRGGSDLEWSLNITMDKSKSDNPPPQVQVLKRNRTRVQDSRILTINTNETKGLRRRGSLHGRVGMCRRFTTGHTDLTAEAVVAGQN